MNVATKPQVSFFWAVFDAKYKDKYKIKLFKILNSNLLCKEDMKIVMTLANLKIKMFL